MMNKIVYVVTATTRTEGIVLQEVFMNLDRALAFEVNDVKNQLRTEYGDKMADHETLQIGFAMRPLK